MQNEPEDGTQPAPAPTSTMPSRQEVREFLTEHQAILVHFSTFPTMSQHRHLRYPDDLKEAIANARTWNICCYVNKPFDQGNNFAGHVGLILDPAKDTSITGLSVEDGASFPTVNGERIGLPNMSRVITMDETISKRPPGGYCEWNVLDYEVLGLFVVEPVQTACEMTADVYDLDGKSPEEIEKLTNAVAGVAGHTIAEIALHFPELDIYRFQNGALEKYDGQDFHVVSHAELYIPF